MHFKETLNSCNRNQPASKQDSISRSLGSHFEILVCKRYMSASSVEAFSIITQCRTGLKFFLVSLLSLKTSGWPEFNFMSLVTFNLELSEVLSGIEIPETSAWRRRIPQTPAREGVFPGAVTPLHHSGALALSAQGSYHTQPWCTG